MSTTPLLNFSKGEIAPELYARIDTGQYNASLKSAENVIVQRYGGIAARPGFRVIGEVDDFDQPGRMVPFQYSTEQQYVLAFQQATSRPLAFGGFVAEEDLKITNAAQIDATTIRLEIAYHGSTVGERHYLTGLTGMDDLNNRQVEVVAVPDASHIDVSPVSGGITYTPLTDSTGTVRGAPVPPPPPPPTPTPTPTPEPPPNTGGGGGSGGGIGGGYETIF